MTARLLTVRLVPLLFMPGTYDGDSVLLYGTVEDEEGILSPEFVVVSEDTSWWKHVDVTVF